MWILVVEALGALGLFLFIVWWTLGPTQRRERDALRALARDEADRHATSVVKADEANADATRVQTREPSAKDR